MVQTLEVVYEDGVLRPLTGIANLKEGQRALITVTPLDTETYADRHAELLRRMEAEHMIEHPRPPSEPKPANWRPLVLAGESLSETIIRMRQQG